MPSRSRGGDCCCDRLRRPRRLLRLNRTLLLSSSSLLSLLFLYGRPPLAPYLAHGWTTATTPTPTHTRFNQYNVKLLVIDHYDSFTYNLVDLFAQLCIEPPRVVSADAAVTYAELMEKLRASSGDCDFDGIVLGPGPGHPLDYPLSLDMIRQQHAQARTTIPILGVCLGHQMLGVVHGASVRVAPRAIHGQVDDSVHFIRLFSNGTNTNMTLSLFDRLTTTTSSFPVTRYHSLHVVWNHDNCHKNDHDKARVVATARAHSDGVCMALQHVHVPHYGVQFHPESIGSQPHGTLVLENFCRICAHHKQEHERMHKKQQPSLYQQQQQVFSSRRIQNTPPPSCSSSKPTGSKYEVFVYPVVTRGSSSLMVVSPVDVMETLLRDEAYSVWLDSSNYNEDEDNNDIDKMGMNNRISILGTASAIGGHRIEYYGDDYPKEKRGVYVFTTQNAADDDKNTIVEHWDMDILTYLDRAHDPSSHTPVYTVIDIDIDDDDDDDVLKSPRAYELMDNESLAALPFEFRGGHMGYLGYEVRFDTERYIREAEMGRQPPPRSLSFSSSPPLSGSSSSDSSYHDDQSQQSINKLRTPTAAFLWADRSFVYDHWEKKWYLVGVISRDNSKHRTDVLKWMQSTANRLRAMQGNVDDFASSKRRKSSSMQNQHQPSFSMPSVVAFVPNRSRSTYNRNFDTCLRHIRVGDSYELCLTNQLETQVTPLQRSELPTPLALYRILRRRNPTPFAAFFNWNSKPPSSMPHHDSNNDCYDDNPRTKTHSSNSKSAAASLAIACSSPERFVSIKRQTSIGEDSSSSSSQQLQVETKPIKGTCARVIPSSEEDDVTTERRTVAEEMEDTQRAYDLQSSTKNRAENLMIVDLLRNDLNRVCETGSVHVSKLMDIESYATVHQMVSTIRGVLNQTKATSIDVLKACFPGGSMTGAPKHRTMELLNEMEERVSRGPYSGCLGYISLNGAVDMNIVIRSAVLTRIDENEESSWHVSIGAGGAITALSESEDEYGEMLLKASSVMAAVNEWACQKNVGSVKEPIFVLENDTTLPCFVRPQNNLTSLFRR